MKKHKQGEDEGMALLLAAVFLAAALIAVGAMTARTVNQTYAVDKYVSYENCMYGLNAALAESKALIEGGSSGMVGVAPGALSQDVWSHGPIPTFESVDSGTVSPKELPGMQVEYFSLDQNWSDDGVDNNGDGQIDDVNENWYHTIHAFARTGNTVRQAEVVMQGDNISVWTNAIFAGAGASGGAIQGNCSIHGSVHILGNNVPAGGLAITTVLDMTGKSLIHNNYERTAGQGLDARMEASAPPLPVKLFNGELVESLSAKLRVKRGMVSAAGASEIGGINVSGNGEKETMDGVYNTDGWLNASTESKVYSDNGIDTPYDLGSKVPLPLLADDWKWPANVACTDFGGDYTETPGSTEINPATGRNYTHAEMFSELSDGDPWPDNVTITVDGADVYINLTRRSDSNPANRQKPNPATCDKGDDYIYFHNNVLEINGQVELDGALAFAGKSGQGTSQMTYTGRGAILCNRDISISADILVCNNGDPNNYVRSFPENNCLGIMTSGTMNLGGKTAQMSMMGGFYAQNMIKSNKQTIVLGTFVSNFFDMGSQVPDIYQVPSLADNLPFGMIGDSPLTVLSQVSWREVIP